MLPTRHLSLALIACGALAACTPMVWIKPGANQQDYANDSYRCELEATRAAPIDYQATSVERRYQDGKRGRYSTTQVNHSDVNASARDRLTHNCMVAHGWRLVPAEQVNPRPVPAAAPGAGSTGGGPVPPGGSFGPLTPAPQGAAGGLCRVGNRVFAFSDKAWYAARVVKVETNGCRVRFDGYGSEENETLPLTRLMPWNEAGPGLPVPACIPGQPVLGLSKKAWYPARAVAPGSRAATCHIHYDGYGYDEDETLPLTELRRL